MSWSDLELNVIRWAEARAIIPRATPMAQAIKTHEEVGELLSALHRRNKADLEDAYGDVLVTLIIGATLAGVDLTECLRIAYDQIKDRKGHLRADGVFVKDAG